MIDKYLCEILVCPKCRSAFEGADRQDSANGELICGKCRSSYPVVSGIPRFLDPKLSELKKKTAEGFGYSWTAFPEYYDFYRQQFLSWIWPVSPNDLKDKVVLDAGCGNGRHVYQTAMFGAKEVVGLDLSKAIDVAHENTREFSNVHLMQADIYNVPLSQVFDYVYCIGVLHHLPDPEEGFRSLTKLLKKGGRISVWVYAKEGNFIVRKFIDPVRLHITSRMPRFLLYVLSFPASALLFTMSRFIIYPLNKMRFTKPVTRFIPLNDYLDSIAAFNFRYIFNIVFDQLVAAKTQYISKNEIESWFKRAGLSDINISFRNKNSWRGTGVKVS
ncbi:MAG: methyltransferase domain-containing protein [Candidatus Omnitrophica bacterium]|nr:methyltransferase domain-containing protein [Candidatus Omnitrophota bacterium]